MYDVLPILDEGAASYLSMSVGLDGARVSRANLLSQRQHFGLAQDEAEGILNLVGGWADELKEYYADFLQGKARCWSWRAMRQRTEDSGLSVNGGLRTEKSD